MRKDVGNKGLDIACFVPVPVAMCRQCYQQYGNIGDYAVIPDAAKSSDCRLLKRNRQQSAENPFHSRFVEVACLEFFNAAGGSKTEAGK